MGDDATTSGALRLLNRSRIDSVSIASREGLRAGGFGFFSRGSDTNSSLSSSLSSRCNISSSVTPDGGGGGCEDGGCEDGGGGCSDDEDGGG